jgi:hypothetical protein
MKQKLLLMAIALFTGLGLVAQQQINNPGFEDWEDVGIGTDEPTHWSSVKTSDNELLNPSAPVIWGKSTDAHSGNYSLHLFNVATFGIVATGTMTNGQTHATLPITDGYVFTNLDDDRYHTAFTQRPDSIVGWYKCTPSTGDFATVKVALHKGYLALPGDETNLIAVAYAELPQQQINSWTRFSIAFEYVSEENPEYFLSILTSGNGYNAVLGSEAWFDDLAFVYNPDGINESQANHFHAFQNKSFLQVETDNIQGQHATITLFNLNGQKLFSENISAFSSTSLSISQIPKGIYMVVLQQENQIETQKIILQ